MIETLHKAYNSTRPVVFVDTLFEADEALARLDDSSADTTEIELPPE